MNPDSSIARYRITPKLVAGGMGEVYRATDTKLGRNGGPLKVPPTENAQDPDRLTRFPARPATVQALDALVANKLRRLLK